VPAEQGPGELIPGVEQLIKRGVHVRIPHRQRPVRGIVGVLAEPVHLVQQLEQQRVLAAAAALSDPEVMAVARSEHRAIVTNNLRDYRPLHADAITPGGPGRFGMVFMPGSYRRTKADTGRIISALEAKLAEYPGDEDLASGECWL
jgi:hypothetical protein